MDVTKREIEVFRKYLKDKFNHNLVVLKIYKTDDRSAWRGISVECDKCSIKLNIFIAAKDRLNELKLLTDRIIHIKNTKINFIIHEMVEDCSINIRDYTPENQIISCEEFIIKSIIE